MEVVGNLNITWWMWAMIVIVGTLLSLCVILKLHELDIYPLREATKIIRRPWVETLLLLFCGTSASEYTRETQTAVDELTPGFSYTLKRADFSCYDSMRGVSP